MSSHKTITSSNHWCDGCGDYFSIQKPGIVLTVKECTIRLCLGCLLLCADECRAVGHAELLAVGA